ncbi:MAG: FKBP-type peptidyl-prolyl cis-trans isomerase [Bacteroidota bacterium]|nr:FKBP-type peptidyl-prolyl cis-trans isomerase [Bacteroidota bacterium]
MLKKYALATAIIFTLLLSSCNKGVNYEKTENGLKYYYFTKNDGPKAKSGDFITVHFSYKTSKDSVLRDTWKEGTPIQVVVQEPTFKGGLEEGLQMLAAGDSVSFQINADSLFQKTFMAPRPDFIDSASYLTFTMKVIKIQGKEEFQKEQEKAMAERRQQMEAMMAAQRVVDDSLIKNYLTANKLTAKSTESGLYYIINKKGKGANPEKGNKVSVGYKGMLLDGSVFDESKGNNFEFTLGVGMVIPGWDEGIALLNPGSKATLIVPSTLGYGPMPMGDKIPANSVLVFDVELSKVTK